MFNFLNHGSTTVRYEGGYATLDPSTAAPDFYHYVTDYQGNNRGVIHAASGQLVQVTHYYPFGAVYADMGTGAHLQPFKHGDKELDMMHGLCHYDYLARPYDPILCTFTRPDSRATSYPHISPRVFCTNNPVNYVDPDGNEVILYTTYLPGRDKNSVVWKFATHSFICVKSSTSEKIKYFAYGQESDNMLEVFGTSRLKRNIYTDDKRAYSGNNDRIKESFTVPVPDGMTEEEFDKTVIDIAESFGNNPHVKYHFNPTNSLQGNCNTSTYTILKKAGVPEEYLQSIKESAKGLFWGFGQEKPWTAEEQKRAYDEFIAMFILMVEALTKIN